MLVSGGRWKGREGRRDLVFVERPALSRRQTLLLVPLHSYHSEFIWARWSATYHTSSRGGGTTALALLITSSWRGDPPLCPTQKPTLHTWLHQRNDQDKTSSWFNSVCLSFDMPYLFQVIFTVIWNLFLHICRTIIFRYHFSLIENWTYGNFVVRWVWRYTRCKK